MSQGLDYFEVICLQNTHLHCIYFNTMSFETSLQAFEDQLLLNHAHISVFSFRVQTQG
mgnify:CR=1 FL=1